MSGDLEGRRFRIAVNNVIQLLFSTLKCEPNDEQEFIFEKPIDGTEAQILQTLSKYLNFTYEWVDFSTNHTWYGMMDSIASKVDFGIFNIFMTFERAQKVSFSYPYIIDLVTFTTPRPKAQTNYMNLIQPFDVWIWISLVLSVILMFAFSLLVVKSKTNILWVIVSIVMRQELHLVHDIRLLVSGWLLAGIVLTSSYAGVIYYITATPLEMGRIDSIYDLNLAQKSGKITIIGIKDGLHYKMIKKLSSGVSQEIGSAMEGVNSLRMAIDLLKSSKPFSLILTKEKLCYTIHHFDIKSHYIPDNSNMDSVFAINFIAIPMNKQFEYKTQFNRFISNSMKSGLIEHWRQTFYQKTFHKEMDHIRREPNMSKKLNQISIEQLGVIYTILISGYIISTLLAILELFVKRCRTSFKSNSLRMLIEIDEMS